MVHTNTINCYHCWCIFPSDDEWLEQTFTLYISSTCIYYDRWAHFRIYFINNVIEIKMQTTKGYRCRNYSHNGKPFRRVVFLSLKQNVNNIHKAFCSSASTVHCTQNTRVCINVMYMHIIILTHFKNATLYVGNCNKEQKLSWQLLFFITVTNIQCCVFKVR